LSGKAGPAGFARKNPPYTYLSGSQGIYRAATSAGAGYFQEMRTEARVVVHRAVKIADAQGDLPEVWAALGVNHGTAPPTVVAGRGGTSQAAEDDARAKAGG
jgi:hypothetical protein